MALLISIQSVHRYWRLEYGGVTFCKVICGEPWLKVRSAGFHRLGSIDWVPSWTAGYTMNYILRLGVYVALDLT
jgi:hypothetical protein